MRCGDSRVELEGWSAHDRLDAIPCYPAHCMQKNEGRLTEPAFLLT